MIIHTELSGNGKQVNFMLASSPGEPHWETLVRVEKQHPAIFIPHVYAVLEHAIKDGTGDGHQRWSTVLDRLPTILGDLIGFK